MSEDDVNRKQIQDVYIRICKDSKFQLEWYRVADLTAKILSISSTEVWFAMGYLDTMKCLTFENKWYSIYTIGTRTAEMKSLLHVGTKI